MTDEQDHTVGSRHEKLTGFSNWSRYSDLTRAMLVEKDVWDLVETGPRPALVAFWEQRIKENRMAVGTATRIIKKGVSNDIFNNIIDITDPREMWEKLCTTCLQVGQGVVYSILQEILNYPRVNKPKEFKKSVVSVFANVRFLVKRLRSAITPNRDIWDSITIVVALNSLHNNFETTTTSMLESGDKTIDEIQQILASAEAKFISKQATGVIGDLAILSRGKSGKRRVTSDDRCFNCNKFGHFGQDCRQKKPKPEEPTRESTRHQQPNVRNQSNTRNHTHIAAADESDSEPKPFRPGVANMVKESQSMQPPRSVWYLNSCASRHLTNNKDLFDLELCPKCLDFTNAGGQVL